MSNTKQLYRNKELEKFIEILGNYKEQVTATPEAAREFLQNVGIIDKKGKLTKHYKHLCIPEEQA